MTPAISYVKIVEPEEVMMRPSEPPEKINEESLKKGLDKGKTLSIITSNNKKWQDARVKVNYLQEYIKKVLTKLNEVGYTKSTETEN